MKILNSELTPRGGGRRGKGAGEREKKEKANGSSKPEMSCKKNATGDAHVRRFCLLHSFTRLVGAF